MINVERTQLLEVLDVRATLASTIVLGSPGSGKSWLLDEFAKEKRRRKEPLVYLYAEDYNISSVKELQAELNIETDFTSALSRMKGPKPVLLIDALDALRGEASQRAFRDLIRNVQRSLPDWRVVASMRTYDALESVQLRELFRGSSSGEFADPRFRISHVMVPDFSDDELGRALDQDARLHTVLAGGSSNLKDLVRNPFNLWLLIHLLDDGVDPKNLMGVSSDVQLLEQYWAYRVGAKADKQERELLLSKLVGEMIESNTLSVASQNVQRPGDALKGLLSDEILRQSVTGRVGFRHNILFDFSIAKLLLDEHSIFDFITADPSRDLFYRSSLSYFLARLWFQDRALFWTTALNFYKKGAGLRPRTSTLPGAAVFHTARTLDELNPLLIAGDTASTLGIQSLLRAIQTFNGLRSSRGDLWLEFVTLAASRLNLVFINEFLALLGQAFETATTRETRRQVGQAAVTTLRWMWQSAQAAAPGAKAQLLSIAASRVLPIVIKCYHSIPDLAREVISDVLKRIGSADASSNEASWLSRNVQVIMEAEPVLVRSIYRAIFAYREKSKEPTHLGGIVLSLQSNRAQDYSMAYYSLEMAFPKFFEVAPIEATLALVDAIGGEVEREHSPRGDPKQFPVAFEYFGTKVAFTSDESAIWGQSVLEESSLKLLAWWLHNLVDALKGGRLAQSTLDELFKTLASGNPYPIVWTRTLEYAKLEPAALRSVVLPLLRVPDVLAAPDTSVAAGDAINALYKNDLLSVSDKTAIENAILEVPKAKVAAIYRAPEKVMHRLLGCIPESTFAVDQVRKIANQARETQQIPPNEPLFKIGSAHAVSFTQEDWYRERGIKIESPENRAALDAKKPLADFEQKYLNDIPAEGEVLSIYEPLLAAQWLFRAGPKTDERVRVDLLTSMAAVAETALKRNDLAIESAMVKLCRSILLTASAEESHVGEDADKHFASPGWGPTPQIEAAQGLMHYIWSFGLSDQDVYSAVKRLAKSPSPAVRYQIAAGILAIYKAVPNEFWPFAQEMLLSERSTGVLSTLLRNIGHGHLQKESGDKVVSLYSARWKIGFPNERQEDSISVFVQVVAELVILFDSPSVEPLLTEILDVEVRHATFLSHLAHAASAYLSYEMAKTSTETVSIRQRAQKLVLRTLLKVQAALAAVRQSKGDEGWEQDAIKTLLGAIDNVVLQIYLAAGTGPHADPDTQRVAPPHVESFFEEIVPILDFVVGEGDDRVRYLSPATAHRLMELFNQLLEYDPISVLDFASRLSTMNLLGYQFDELAVSEMTKFVERFLADYKQYLADRDVAAKLGQILDMFIDAGWPEATRLLSSLDKAMA